MLYAALRKPSKFSYRHKLFCILIIVLLLLFIALGTQFPRAQKLRKLLYKIKLYIIISSSSNSSSSIIIIIIIIFVLNTFSL